jgi:hypothetical protein
MGAKGNATLLPADARSMPTGVPLLANVPQNSSIRSEGALYHADRRLRTSAAGGAAAAQNSIGRGDDQAPPLPLL